jgi:hypothetical protein
MLEEMARRHSASLVVLTGTLLVACGSGPSKSTALEVINASIKEDGSCTLPVSTLTQLKVQHTTKAMCVPKEGADKARACVDALIAAGATHRMPDAYMLAWPDEVASASLTDLPAYERRARNLVYSTCIEITGDLRNGRFTCADARADKVLKVTEKDKTHADVEYQREITLRPALAAIDAACDVTAHPPADVTVPFVKGESGWTLESAAGAADGRPN